MSGGDRVTETRISDIRIENRFRREYGDIQALAASIETCGLLQPIGIDSSNRLLFGERRIKAYQHLGLDTIPARIINVDSILLAEHDENELRKDFTHSERVAIGQAIEREVGNRRGQRTDRLPENFPEVEKGKETRDIAAAKAGFGNAKTYQQAKTVVDKGSPELVEAMDQGRASVSAAAVVASLPKEEQSEVVAKGDKEIRAKAKKVKEEKAAKPKKKRRRPLAEAFQIAALELTKSVERIERLMADDRLSQNAEEVAPMVRDDLMRASKQLQTVCSELSK